MAHNLDQEATFLNFDRPTLDPFAVRSSVGQSLIGAGDTVGLVLKSTPGPGTATGAGGYAGDGHGDGDGGAWDNGRAHQHGEGRSAARKAPPLTSAARNGR